MLIWRISKLYEKITLIKPEHYGNVHHTAQIEMEWMQAMWFLMLLYKIFSPKYQIVSLMSTTLQKAAQGHIKLISFCCFLSFPSLNMFLQTLWECVQYSTHHITSHEWSPPLKKKNHWDWRRNHQTRGFCLWPTGDLTPQNLQLQKTTQNLRFFFFFATNNWLIRCLENETLNLRFSKSITMYWLSNTDECKRN